MVQLTVRQAALQAGISRQTMFRHIKDGKVSATLDRNGQKQIDAAELVRVFGDLTPQTVSDTTRPDRSRVSATAPPLPAYVALQVELSQVKAQLELKAALLEVAQERNAELKAAAQRAENDRDRIFRILETKLLEAPKAKPRPKKKAPVPAPELPTLAKKAPKKKVPAPLATPKKAPKKKRP